MRLAHKLVDAAYMARDFVGVLVGTDYFHRPDLVGRFFADRRSYYIDFRYKAAWTGEYREQVPLLFLPSLGAHVFFPGMILQYGLGTLDRYFEGGGLDDRERVRHVSAWLQKHRNAGHYFDNLSRELNSRAGIEYHSNNSAMTQGLALSFLTRAVRYGLLQDASTVVESCHAIYRNMMLPLEKGGGALYRNGGTYLCEYCRTDGHVVLNGWIFALLGLIDYRDAFGGSDAAAQLQSTLDTLEKSLPSFILADDHWSYYDNKGRISSPTYQLTHMSQTEVLFRLTGRESFGDANQVLVDGYTMANKCKYTFSKVWEKLRDPYRYATVR